MVKLSKIQTSIFMCFVPIATELQLLLENSMTRNLFLDDLMELRAFLSRRLQELTSETNSTIQVRYRLRIRPLTYLEYLDWQNNDVH